MSFYSLVFGTSSASHIDKIVFQSILAVVTSISKLLYLQSTELIRRDIFLACDGREYSIMSWNLPAWTALFAEVTVSWECFQLWMHAIYLESKLLVLTNITSLFAPSFESGLLDWHFFFFFSFPDHTLLHNLIKNNQTYKSIPAKLPTPFKTRKEPEITTV